MGNANVADPHPGALPGKETWSDVGPPNITEMGPEDA